MIGEEKSLPCGSRRELEAELEASVVQSDPAGEIRAPAAPAPVKQLAQTELRPVELTPKPNTEYGTKKDNYYPTARGPARKSGGD